MPMSFLTLLLKAVDEDDRQAVCDALAALFEELRERILDSWMRERQVEVDDALQEFILHYVYPAKADWRDSIRGICGRCGTDKILKDVCIAICRKIIRQKLHKSDPNGRKLRRLRDQVRAEATARKKTFVVGDGSSWPVGLYEWIGGGFGDFPEKLKGFPIPHEALESIPAPLSPQRTQSPEDPYEPESLADRMHWTLDAVKRRLRGSLLSRYVWEYFCKADHITLHSLDAPSGRGGEAESGSEPIADRKFDDSRIWHYLDYALEAWRLLDEREREVLRLHTLAEYMLVPGERGATATVRAAAEALGVSHQTVYNIEKDVKRKLSAFSSTNVFRNEEQFFACALVVVARSKGGGHAFERS